MLIALGFFVATLFAAIAAQFVWRRAVTVTTRALSGATDEAAESERARELDLLIQRQQAEIAPLQAEIGQLRRDTDALAAERDAALRDWQAISNENNSLRAEADRLAGELAALSSEAESLRASLRDNAELAAERAERFAVLKQELAALEAVIGEAPAPNREAAALAPIAAEAASAPSAPLAFDDEEAARTLAEVKATLERLDAMGAEAHASYPAEEQADPAEIHVGDKALLARIRALEAGVAN